MKASPSLATHAEVLARGPQNTTSPSPDWLAPCRARLSLLAMLLAGLSLVGLALPSALFPRSEALLGTRALFHLTIWGLLLDAVILWLTRRAQLTDERVLSWGFVYQGLRVSTLAFFPLSVASAPGLTWAHLITLVFPLALPLDRIWSHVLTLFSASAPLLALGLYALLEPTTVSASHLLHTSLGSLFTFAFGLFVLGAVRHFTREDPNKIGSYNLVTKIGTGGMGEVWQAEHRFLSRPAAIKLIPRSLQTSADSAEKIFRRFRREAQVTASLNSPHTVQVFDYGTTDEGSYYYVMEHLDGFDLQKLVQRYGPLTPGRALYFLQQICDSIGEAHNAGLIHRDLKPSNLFIVRRGLQGDFIKVLDFGLVALGAPLRTETFDGKITAAGMMTGTPAYMSPEMVTGDELDPRADLYSLGCVLFYLVTGKLLYPGLSSMQMALAHAHEPPPLPSQSSAQPIPDDVERLILLLLEKDPARRPASAEELSRLILEMPTLHTWSSLDSIAWWNQNRPIEKSDSMRVAVRRDSELSR